MNRSFLSIVKSLLAATVAISGLAHAAQATAPAKADPAKGATLYDSGDAARGLPACVSCHGAAGNSTISINPTLSAQIEAYTYKQLVDFTTPARNNPVMSTFARMLTEQEKRDVSAYLAAQNAKQNAARNAATVELGKAIYRGGIAERGVAACASCHGASGGGMPALFPRVAGQNADYTVGQLVAFKSGARKNSAQMSALAKRMSDEEMKAVADYIAGMK